MPEYLAPGVYVEDRGKSIRGVSTSTVAFIGPTRFGPPQGRPELLTSFAEYARIYGDLAQLALPTSDNSLVHNYVAHGVRAFFSEGGTQCYVMRVQSGATAASVKVDENLTLGARYEGAYGNSLQVAMTLALGQNLLKNGALKKGVALQPYDTLVGLKTDGSAEQLKVTAVTPAGPKVQAMDGKAPEYSTYEAGLFQVTATVTVAVLGPEKKPTQSTTWNGLGLSADHPSSIIQQFAANPPDRATQLYVPLVLTATPDPAAAILGLTYDGTNTPLTKWPAAESAVLQTVLAGGADGDRPDSTAYQGADATQNQGKTGLMALQDLDDISIVAAPGSSLIGKTQKRVDGALAAYTADDVMATAMALIQHCQTMRYRVAVLDTPEQQLVSDVLDFRSQLADPSGYGALYYPWVRVKDPVTGGEINQPPSGFIAGIYARSDNKYNVSKAPANEPIQSAIGLEIMINKAQQEALSQNRVNCIRFFPGRGNLVWGARTLSNDSDWTYVNVRRYMCYLEHSLENSTQWVIFRNNGPDLWQEVASSIASFLYNEWAERRLLGDTAAQAFFVRCDRTTMTQFDIDSGRLICEIGVAVLKPAEFIIFRIGQWIPQS